MGETQIIDGLIQSTRNALCTTITSHNTLLVKLAAMVQSGRREIGHGALVSVPLLQSWLLRRIPICNPFARMQKY